VKKNLRAGYSLITVIIIFAVLVFLGYLGAQKAIDTTVESGKKEYEGTPIQAFVDGGVQDMMVAQQNIASTKALWEAISKGDTEKVRMFLGPNTNVNIPNSGGATMLHHAAANGHLEIARMLCKNEADVTIKSKRGLTSLHFALSAKKPNTEMVTLLLDEWADLNAKDNVGQTPMHLAARNADTEILQLLMDDGADINPKNKNGDRPLTIVTDALNNDKLGTTAVARLKKNAKLLRDNGAKN